MPKPVTSKSELIASVGALLELGQFAAAQRTLELAMDAVREYQDWQDLREVFLLVSFELKLSSVAWAALYARCLRGSREVDALLEFCAQAMVLYPSPGGASIALEQAWALLAAGEFQESKKLLDGLLVHLNGWSLGFAHRCLGELHFKLGLPWKAHFDHARVMLHGRLLGLMLIDQGNCLDRNQEHHEARTCWFEALGLLRQDAYHQAWLRYSLAASYLRENNPLAEAQFLLVQHLSRSQRAQDFRVWAMLGLGAVRRTHGEWRRAEYQYRKAIKRSTTPEEREQAWWGLGQTLRLLNRSEEALECFHNALQGHDVSWINVSRGAVLLLQGRDVQAEALLEQLGHLTGNEVPRCQLVRAELARARGQVVLALGLLRAVPVTSYVLREELRCFPSLLALAQANNLPLPEPLVCNEPMVVRVQAIGVLQVFVNDRQVPLQATSRVGELLVLLLEHDGHVSLDVLMDSLWPKLSSSKDSRNRARKSTWELLDQLRDLLGWDESVVASGSVYRLDSQTIWEYDVRQARTDGLPVRSFLSGVYSDWARETERELQVQAERFNSQS